MRKKHPTYEKSKIKVLFDKLETGVKISESSIGRILSNLNIPKSNTAPRQKRHLVGEKIQIDHMSVQGVKHFAAIDRQSKCVVSCDLRQNRPSSLSTFS